MVEVVEKPKVEDIDYLNFDEPVAHVFYVNKFGISVTGDLTLCGLKSEELNGHNSNKCYGNSISIKASECPTCGMTLCLICMAECCKFEGT